MKHVVNISGGKDSAACYMLAMMRGRDFRAVTADTGHENEQTYEWIERLHTATGGPKVEFVKADFTEQIRRKRELVKTKWVQEGVDDSIIEAALEVLNPTGIPFLDLCIWKGRFPSRMSQFCTEWLKAAPIEANIFAPIRAVETVVSWQGERRDESPARRNLARVQRIKNREIHDRVIFRPILHWSAENTFALHRHFGLDPNPLYSQGSKRVGCYPCVNSNKDELRQMFQRAPALIEALRKWELIVSKASKRGQATFFAAGTTPQGDILAKAQKRGERLDEKIPTIYDVAEWSKTIRGGRQYSGLSLMSEDGIGCTSHYGLCE